MTDSSGTSGAPSERDDFLSGNAGEISGIRASTKALLRDCLADTVALTQGQPWRLREAAQAAPRLRVLALAVERTDQPNLLANARRELLASHHDVHFASKPVEGRGKFENLGELLAQNPPGSYDWLLVIDDDVSLPKAFLDVFLFLAERFDLRLAQPAHRARSHAAWHVTRRRIGSVARETAFVEIGPVVALHETTFAALLPFPPLRTGWGLDVHWSALASQHGWRMGIIDATAVRHGLRAIATTYDRDAAIAEGREFLNGRPYTSAGAAQRTLVTHRTWR